MENHKKKNASNESTGFRLTQFGDIRKMDGTLIDPVDIITGGSPCQNFSSIGQTSGLDSGLNGNKSSLFFEMVRVISEMRTTHKKPRFVVLENVVNILHINECKDFTTILRTLIDVVDQNFPLPSTTPAHGYAKAGMLMSKGEHEWSIAWRTIDSSLWGSAQKRRRVMLVVDYDGLLAPELLFAEKNSNQRVSSPKALGSINEDIFGEQYWGTTTYENYPNTGKGPNKTIKTTIDNILQPEQAVSKKYTLKPHQAAKLYSDKHSDVEEVAFVNNLFSKMSCGINCFFWKFHPKYDNINSLIKNGTFCIFRSNLDRAWHCVTDHCNTIRCIPCATGTKTALLVTVEPSGYVNDRYQPGWSFNIRQFTPIEVERMFGYPTNWTEKTSAGKTIADTHRYRMLGNTITLQPWEWLMSRLSSHAPSGGVLTHGSLFDGIGGFPACAKAFGINTIWTSEIDKWAIEVVKRNFGGTK